MHLYILNNYFFLILKINKYLYVLMGFPGGATGKDPTCQCRRGKRCRFYPWVGKVPWRRAWQPIPVSLENPKDRGAWQVIVHRVAKSWTRMKRLSMHVGTHTLTSTLVQYDSGHTGAGIKWIGKESHWLQEGNEVGDGRAEGSSAIREGELQFHSCLMLAAQVPCWIQFYPPSWKNNPVMFR